MNEPSSAPEQKSLRHRLSGRLLSTNAVRFYWGANVATLLVSTLWVLRDGKFADGVAAFIRHFAALWGTDAALAVVPPLLWPRVDALWCLLIVGTLSGVGIAAGLIAGERQHRNIRSWLVVMLLLASWLTLSTTWPELVWRGQIWRVRGSVSAFEEFAKDLMADWPQTDGQIDGLGPFMAYPVGNPRTLMFMATPTVPKTNTEINVVERRGDESLHFQLAGHEEGVWLVRESGNEPQPFFSGLGGEYIPVQYRRVSPGWFLVRYVYAPTVLVEPGVSTAPR